MAIPEALNQRVIIQQRMAGQDEYGQPVLSWTDIAGPLWAAVLDLSGREYLAAAAVQSQVLTKVILRARPGITAAMRVRHRSDIYNIEAVLLRTDHRLVLMCSKGSHDG